MSHPLLDREFYETPQTFTRYLFREVWIRGNVFEPCVGSGAIIKAAGAEWPQTTALIGPGTHNSRQWISNDLDPRWIGADYHLDAAAARVWQMPSIVAAGGIDWTVSNPPFKPAIDIMSHALAHSAVGVAMHLRASMHEVLKGGIRRTWMGEHTPTGILWLPRFGYQRSKTTGKWTTDSVCACWVIWLKDPNAPQFIRYAPEWVLDELEAETPAYRTRMDALMKEAA